MTFTAVRNNIVEVLLGGTWIDVDPGSFKVDDDGGFTFIDGDHLSFRVVGKYADIQAVRELRSY